MVLFFSDLHIDPLRPDERRHRFLMEFLNHLDGVEKIYLVGDIFDFWFEYRYMIPSGYLNILEHFTNLNNNGVEINFIKGNHDQWAGSSLTSAGMIVHERELDVEYYGLKIHLTHGDFLDKTIPNQMTQFFFRSRICQALFSHIPHEIGFPVACHIAQRNRNFKLKSSLIRVFRDYANKKICEGYDLVVMGHLHHPLVETLENGIYINIGDWIKNFTFAGLEKNKIFLKNYLTKICHVVKL